jgi:serine/threonine protein kinase
VILDSLGYVKLTDFGLSKILDNEQSAQSICGTSEYLAPEMIKKAGYGPAVDWWCLGCLIYEMVQGFPPFESHSRLELFEQIVFKEPSMTGVPFVLTQLSENMTDLVKKLLTKEPEKRIGSSGVE